MKILFLQQIAILKAKHSKRPQSYWGNMTKLPSNDEITLFDGTQQKEDVPKQDFTCYCCQVQVSKVFTSSSIVPVRFLIGQLVISIHLANVELPNVELPNVELLNVELPNVELPNAELPNAELPNTENYPTSNITQSRILQNTL